MKEITIREMTSADLDDVTRLYVEVFNPSYISFSEISEGKADASGMPSNQASSIFRKQLASHLSNSPCGLFVAIFDGNVVGFAISSLRCAEAGHIECWLDDLGVSHNYRGQGIGEKLVKQVQDWGHQEEAKYYFLESGVRNEGAHHLFERLGFHPLAVVFCKSHLC